VDLEEHIVAYAKEPLMTDPQARSALMAQMVDVAK